MSSICVRDSYPHGRRRAFRGSGSPPIAVTYGPTPRSSRGGTPKSSAAGNAIASRHCILETASDNANMKQQLRKFYFVRVAMNIGALAERAGIVLYPRNDICRRRALV